jgi:D-amino-acid oxidase
MIVHRCAQIDERLKGARIREIRVGLRPARHLVRLEWSEVDGLALIHNYGHGGAGLTLSWGCAAEVGRLIG